MLDIVISAALIVISAIWTGVAIFDLGLWIPGVSADSGFVPMLFSLLTLLCSIPMLLDSIKKYKARDVEAEKAAKAADPNSPKEKILAFVRKYCPAFFGIFGILCLQYLGLIPMVLLLVLGWMKLINNFSWPKSVLIAGVVTVVIYLIFDVWLQIPFPGLI